jgi:RHS repeat-associated protein
MTYDARGNLLSLTLPEGERYELSGYDAIGNPSTIKDARGNTLTTTYNAKGWVLTERNQLNQTYTYRYDRVGNLTSVTDPKNNETKYAYNGRDQLIKITDPAGGITEYEFDADGKIKKFIDAGTTALVAGQPTAVRGTSTVSYDADGRIFSVTDANNNVTSYTYGSANDGLAGLLKTISYPTYVEEYKYDNRNRMTQTIQVLDSSTRYVQTVEYDARGNVISQTDPLGRKTSMTYDNLSRLRQLTDAIGGTTTMLYDARDNLVDVTDAKNSKTRFEFDRSSRQTRSVRPLGEATTVTYDPNGNVATRTNARGDKRTLTYDAANRLIDEKHANSAGSTVRTITYTYDERSLLTGYNDSGDTNAPTGVGTPNSASYGYDPDGRLINETTTVRVGGTDAAPINVSKTTTFTYHANGLKASMTYPSIDATGQVSGGTVTWQYDAENLLQSVGLPSSGVQTPRTISYAYQWMAPIRKVLPGAVINMEFDALQRPTRIKTQAIGSGTSSSPLGAVLQDLKHSFNPLSRITQRNTKEGVYNYEYDDLNRLTQAAPPSAIDLANGSRLSLPIEAYSHDAVHNRTKSLHQTGALANAWTTNANHQLAQWGDPSASATSAIGTFVAPKVAQTFDANGNLTRKSVTPEDTSSAGIRQGRQSQGFTYSASERLIETADANGNAIAQYAYDPFGRRIKKIVRQALTADSATGTTLYFYSDEGLIAESDESGNISTTYGWHPQRSVNTDPIFKRDHQGATATEHYYHNDHAGTPQKLTNAQGEITWAAYADAFGRTTVDTGITPQSTPATTNNLRFAGQYDDSETGLHHNGLRDYDPSTGRYLQTDPIGLAGGLNTYAYVEGDPVNFIDPTGENPAALLYVYARCVAQCTAQSAAGDFLDNKCPEFGDYAKDCALSCANPLNWLGGRGGPGRVGARGPGRGAGPPPVRGPQQRIEAPEIGKNVGGNTGLGKGGAGGAGGSNAARGTGPIAGGGAKLENLTTGDIARLQNAANRTGTEISVVGSRARGTARANSDWDYVIPQGTSRSTRHSLSSSVPEGPRGLGEPRNQDFFREAVDRSRPYITFTPIPR